MHRWLVLFLIALIALTSGCSHLYPSIENSRKVREPAPDRMTLSHLVRGSFHESQGDYRRALYEFRQALAEDTSSIVLQEAIIYNLIRLEAYDEFETAALRLLRFEPDHMETRLGLAYYYQQQNRYDLAAEQLRYVLQNGSGNDPALREDLMTALLVTDDFDGFLTEFHQAIQQAHLPSLDYQQYYLHLAEEQQLLPEETRRVKKALRHHREPSLYLLLSALQMRQGELKQSEKTLRRVINTWPDSLDYRFELIRFQMSILEDFPAALTELDHILTIDPEQLTARSLQALALEQNGDIPEAEKALRQLVSSGTDSSETMLLLAEFYLRQEMRADAIAVYREFLEQVNPDHAGTLNNYAYLLVEERPDTLSEETLNEALSCSQKSVELDPDNAYYLDTLGWIYFLSGNPNLAREKLEEALAIMPDEPILLRHLAAILRKSDPEESERLLKKVQDFEEPAP